MRPLRPLLAAALLLTASGFASDVLGEQLGPIEYKGYLVFDYPEGENPITSIVFNVDPTLADSLIIVNVPQPWSHSYAGGALTLTGGTLEPGGTVQVTVSLSRYYEDGEYPVTSVGTTATGEVSRSSGPLLVGELYLLNFLATTSAYLLPLAGVTVLLGFIELFLSGRKPKGLDGPPSTAAPPETPPLDPLESAKRRFDLTMDSLTEAQKYLEERRARVAELEAELEALEQSAESYVTEGGVQYHLIDGGRVTSDGLTEITDSVRDALEQARETEESAEQSVTDWEERVRDAQNDVEEAESAASEDKPGEAETPDDAGESPGEEPPGDVVSGPAAPAVVEGGEETEEKQERKCEEGARELRPGGRPESILVNVDFSLFVEAEGFHDVKAAQMMSFGLANLARDLDLAGSLLGGMSSGKSIAGGLGAMRSGTYVTGAAGLIEGTATGAMTAAGAGVGTGGMQVSIPTSPPEAIAEVLEATARLGSIVAGKVGEWLQMNVLYNVRVRFFTQRITATPYEIWECKGNEWVCKEKIYEITIGKLRPGGQPNPKSFRLDSDLARHKLEQEINRATRMAKGRIESGVRRRLQFEQQHQPKPCGS
ncbi:hypothetical protein JXL21_02290 [Candidatus Bathyarchaeota archaeon]|nr:hypothetical protein [Candidatus Bathyarchaeota archaeon]